MAVFRFRSIIFSLTLAILFLPFAAANDVETEEDVQSKIGEIHEDVDVDLVSVYLTATNKNGDFVSDLGEQELMLKEDGVPQQISYFTNFAKEQTRLPLTLVFLVDDSPSMSEGTKEARKIDIARTAGQMVLKELGPEDKMYLATFHEQESAEIADAAKVKFLQERIQSIKTPYGVSPLFDTMDTMLQKIRSEWGRKIFIVCSDGQDNSSLKNLNDVLLKIQQSPDTVVISLGTVDYERSRSFSWYGEEEDYKKGKEVMQKLAENGGGYAFFPSKYKDLDPVMAKLRQAVKSQYSLAYHSTNRKSDGAWRRIEIVSKRPELKLRYRYGYYASTPETN